MYQIPSFVFVNIWQCLSDCYLYFLNIECRMGYVCMILVCTVIFYTGLRHLCFFLYCHSVCFSTGSLPLYFVNPVINIRFTLLFCPLRSSTVSSLGLPCSEEPPGTWGSCVGCPLLHHLDHPAFGPGPHHVRCLLRKLRELHLYGNYSMDLYERGGDHVICQRLLACWVYPFILDFGWWILRRVRARGPLYSRRGTYLWGNRLFPRWPVCRQGECSIFYATRPPP